MIAATGGNPHCCCLGCRVQGSRHGLISSWNKVTWPAFVKTPPGSEGQEGQHNLSAATFSALATLPREAAHSYVAVRGYGRQDALQQAQQPPANNSHPAVPWPQQRGLSDSRALHHLTLPCHFCGHGSPSTPSSSGRLCRRSRAN